MPRYDVMRTLTVTEVEWVTVEAATPEAATAAGTEMWEDGSWCDSYKSEVVRVHGDPEWTVEEAK